MSSSSITGILPNEHETHKHVFFCKTYHQALQAMLYAMDKQERTAVVMLYTRDMLDGRFRYENTDLITLVPVNAHRALLPAHKVISLPLLTKEELMVARWLQDYDVTLHAFPPAKEIMLYTRDDIIVHDGGDIARMRINGHIPETDNPFVYRVLVRELPSDYNPETDKKLVQWDYMQVLENLSQDNLAQIKKWFCVDKNIATGDNDVLLIHYEPDPAIFPYRETVHYLVDTLVEDLCADGYNVWFKPHHKRKWTTIIDHPNVHLLPAYLPAELLLTATNGKFEYIAGVRSNAVGVLCERMQCKAIEGFSVDAKKVFTYGVSPALKLHGVRAYTKGLLRIARALIKNKEVLRKWEYWNRVYFL